MIKELVVDDSYQAVNGNCALIAVEMDGSSTVIETWFDDERSCSVEEWEFLSWVGKPVDELLSTVRDIKVFERG